MGFEFSLLVTGLCAFVPDDDDRSMRIVLVNARDYKDDGSSVDGSTPNTCIHFPILAVPPQFVTAKGRRPTFAFRNKTLLPNNPNFLAFSLENDDLQIIRTIDPPVELPDPVWECPDRDTIDSFGWIARMQNVGSRKMNAAHKKGELDTRYVLARLRLAHGKCSTTAFALDPVKPDGTEDDRVVKWIYTDKDAHELPDYRPRALAELMTVRTMIDDSVSREVIITSVMNDRIVLAPAGGLEPQAVLLNVPLPDLLNENKATKPRKRDHHFLHFYRIAENTTPTFAPFPLTDERCDEIIGGLGGPKCPPTFFEG